MKNKIYYQIKDFFTSIGTTWDKDAPTEEKVIEFAHENINQEPKKNLSPTKYSWEYVLAHSGETINSHLRGGRMDEELKAITDMVASHQTKIPLTLYRGICEYVFNKMKKNAETIEDADLLEKSFLQTSLVKGHEIPSSIRLRIHVPAGTNCVYLGNVNDEQHYYEVDIQRNAKLKIVSIDKEYINCELLGTH